MDQIIEWVHQMVIVRKYNGKIWLCLDPRELNMYMVREQFRLPDMEDILAKIPKPEGHEHEKIGIERGILGLEHFAVSLSHVFINI
ncbi:K02A2.6-like [Cordylochernes scorpioides]|uniref:K02A2.6-like n=1 Tax=Cordylochernes scorpioides TaxID=51811 RepID=A0ABY6KC01_9ARAC|nr:K02A2.6-like [Cordylochernes scorpioides]UYV66318.1 K02A2.6-like [Cordylochernes scorpioides]